MARFKQTKRRQPSSSKSRAPKRMKQIKPLKPPKRPYQGHVKKRQPYLSSYRVGDCTHRIWIRLPEATKKKCMSYCLDCVRMQLILYCDGETDRVAQACRLHATKPNPKHATANYDTIRDALLARLMKKGLMYNREQTKPILRYKFGCGHGNRYDGFDASIVAKVEKVRQT